MTEPPWRPTNFQILKQDRNGFLLWKREVNKHKLEGRNERTSTGLFVGNVIEYLPI